MSRAAPTVLLAADVGTSALRVAALTPDGRPLHVARRPLAVAEPVPGWAEIDPELWWQALGEAVGEVLGHLPEGAAVQGLCLSGATRAQVVVDARGMPLRPAMLFADRRAEAEARDLARRLPTDNPAEALSAFHAYPRLAWLSAHEPEVLARTHAVLEPKDWLNLRLTGELAADAVTLSRLDAFPEAAEVLGWAERLLDRPRLWPWQEVGRVRAGTAPFDRLRGVPVSCGAMDTWATAIGAGAIRPGQAYDVAGTSEAVGLLSAARRVAPGLVAVRWGEAVWQLGGPTQVGADSALWAHRALRVEGALEAAIARVGARLPTADWPVFLPWLAGERTPIWRSDVRGSFAGLGRDADGEALFWSVLEGVAHALGDVLAIAAAATGERAVEMRIAGGGARSDAWCQLKADVTALPVIRTTVAETGLVGAAMCAAVGTGLYPDLDAAAAMMCRTETVFEPRTALAEVFQERAQRWARAKALALAMALP